MWETSPDVDIKVWRPFPQVMGAINVAPTTVKKRRKGGQEVIDCEGEKNAKIQSEEI